MYFYIAMMHFTSSSNDWFVRAEGRGNHVITMSAVCNHHCYTAKVELKALCIIHTSFTYMYIIYIGVLA